MNGRGWSAADLEALRRLVAEGWTDARIEKALANPGDGGDTNVLTYHSVRLYTLLQAGDPATAVGYFESKVLPSIRGGLSDIPVDLFSRAVVAYVQTGDPDRARQMLSSRPDSEGPRPSRVACRRVRGEASTVAG